MQNFPFLPKKINSSPNLAASDPRCSPTIFQEKYFNQKYVPDYNFDVFTKQIKKILSEDSKWMTNPKIQIPIDSRDQCLKEIDLIINDYENRHTNGTTLVQSWGSPIGLSDVQNLPDKIKNDPKLFSGPACGLPGYFTGNRMSPGKPSLCHSSYPDNIIKTETCGVAYGASMASLKYPDYARTNRQITDTQGFCLPSSCARILSDIQFKKPLILTEGNPWFPKINNGSDPWQYQDTSIKPALKCDISPFVYCQNLYGERRSDEELNFLIPELNASENRYDSWFYGAVSVIGIVVLCIIFSSIYYSISSLPSIQKHKKRRFYFAIQNSCREIFKIPARRRGFTSIDGLRALSMFWMIIYHETYISYTRSVVDNLDYWYQNYPKTYWWYFFVFGQIAVDTFFAIGGFLSSFILYKKFSRFEDDRIREENEDGVSRQSLIEEDEIAAGQQQLSNSSLTWQKFKSSKLAKILELMISRWLRFTPTVIGVMFFSMIGAIMPNANKLYGAYWRNFGSSCKGSKLTNSFWGMLLYLGTWSPDYNRCLGWLWYLANDMFYHYVAIIILALLTSRNSKSQKFIGWTILILMLIIPIIFKFVSYNICLFPITTAHYTSNLDYFYGYFVNGTEQALSENELERFQNYCDPEIIGDRAIYMTDTYYKPYARATPYFMGVILGYLISCYKVENFKVDKVWRSVCYILLWILAVGTLILVIVTPRGYEINPSTYSKIFQANYMTFFREIWALSILTIVLLCEKFEFDGQTSSENLLHNALNKICQLPVRFLKHNFWMVFSNLNFSTYCFHYMVITFIMYFRDLELAGSASVSFFVGYGILNIIGSYFCGFLLYVTFEGPFSKFTGLIFRAKA